MSKHYNPELTKQASRIFKFKGVDQLTDDVKGIVAIVPLEDTCTTSFITASNATGATILTTPLDKDVYIVSAQLSYIKDATSTATDIRLVCTVENNVIRLISLPGLTLTAGNMTETITFKHPIKVDRGTQININSNTGVANIAYHGVVTYYTV